MSPRRITLSTVGLLPALERLAHEPVMPNLAISLHAPTDLQRGELVPLNRKYGVADIVDACRRFPLKRRSRITFEYVLLAGVNDSPQDAREAGQARRRRQVEGQPDSAERRAPAFRSSGRRMRRSIASRRSSPTTASRFRSARAAAATSAPPAAS